MALGNNRAGLKLDGALFREEDRSAHGQSRNADQVFDANVDAVSTGVSVTGIQGAQSSCGCLPPDANAAAGPSNVVEVVNTAMEIIDKSGNLVSGPTPLLSFFSGHGFTVHSFSDAVVIFDESVVNASGPNGRFIIIVNDFTSISATNSLDFAISNDADATHGFTNFRQVNVGETSFFADFLGNIVGFNDDAYFVDFNMFSTSTGAFDHPQIFTIDKASVLAGNFTTYHHDLSNTLFNVIPARMHGAASGGPEYFVTEGATLGQIAVIKETNVLSNTPNDVTTNLNVANYNTQPPAAPQPSGTVPINDSRMLSAAWRNNVLVSTHIVGTGSPLEAHARWYQFDTTSTPTLSQSGEINPGSGIATYYPSIDINTAGDLGMTYMESSSSEFISMYVTGRTSTDPTGTMQTGVRTRAGTTNYTGTRMGDYSGTSVDPSDGITFWSANEFINNSSAGLWATGIASFSVISATFTVTTTADHDDGVCDANDCTLREAITAANANGGGIIRFASGVTGTIQLASVLPSLNANIAIQGPGADLLAVRRNTGGDYRIFNIASASVIASISGLTIANGNAPGLGFGGGISNAGMLTLTNAAISGNTAGFSGGGIYNDFGATVTITNSTISNNSAASVGGIFNNGTLNLTNSTLSGNMATSGNGGGIAAGTVVLTNSTISANSASGSGGGVFQNGMNGGSVKSRNTIIALNTAPSGPDISGPFISDGHNLIGNGTGGSGFTNGVNGDQVGVADPKLGSLANNGGSTQTHALLSGSTAINAGDDALAPKTDQRGYLRAGVGDIGAFEFGGAPMRITSITRLANSHIALQGLGVPNGLHTIQASPDLSPNSFNAIDTVAADAGGALQYDDAGAVGLTKRFYRLSFP